MMLSKSLTLAAFILNLGAIAGCDDPEVEGKISNVLAYGMEEAEVTCNVNPFVPNGETGGCMGVNWPLHVSAQRFIDGSTLIRARKSIHGDFLDMAYLNRQKPVQIEVEWSGSELEISVENGQLNMDWSYYYGNCPPEPSPPNLYFDLDDETKCTGRNLEAFGVVP